MEGVKLKVQVQFGSFDMSQVHFRYMDGALMENGILVEFYSNDNLQGIPFEKTIMQNTQSVYTPSTFDRYSYRATCYVKPPYSEEYSLIN